MPQVMGKRRNKRKWEEYLSFRQASVNYDIKDIVLKHLHIHTN